METKTNATVFMIIVLIILCIAIVLKIQRDKKRKSLAISFAEREGKINYDKNEPRNETMKSKGKRSFLNGIPSLVSALVTFVAATIILFGIGEGLKGDIGEFSAYIIYDLLIIVCSFLIVKQNPGSIWYVPFVCNILGIISSIAEPTFWKGSLWIIICSGWGLSIIASIIGARAGKRKTISDNLLA
jgi:hypothetical protein